MSVPELRFPEFEGEWDEFKLKEISTEIKRTSENVNEDVLTISASVGFISQKERWNKVIAGNSLKKYVLIKKNEFSYNRGNSKLFPYGCIYRLKNHDSALVPNVYRSFSLNGQNPLFFEQYFIGGYIDRQLRRIISSSARMDGLLNISKSDFFDVKIKAPKIDEQAKIGFFLAKVDEKIEKLEKKLELWEAYKKGMMQKIFSQKLRFKNENGEDYPDWEENRLGNIFTERKEKGFENLQLLSVTLNKGVIKRDEIEGKDNSSENKSNYKRVMPNDIPYNSMRMWQGASGVSPYEGIVSPAYTVLIPNEDISSKYFGYYFKAPDAIYQFKKYSQGLTSDTWNLKYPLLSEIKFKHPFLEEQHRITTFLIELDKKIRIIEKELYHVKEFKKGLLQKMFC